MRILRGRYVIFHRLMFGLGKSERGVQRDGPNKIGGDRADHKRYTHDVKECEEYECVREKTAPRHEF